MKCLKLFLASFLIVFCCISCNTNNSSIPENTVITPSIPAESTAPSQPYAIVKEFNFDDTNNLQYIHWMGSFTEDGQELQVTKEDAELENGSLLIGSNSVRAIGQDSMLNARTAIHFHWKATQDKTCSAITVSPPEDELQRNQEIYRIFAQSCINNTQSFFAKNVIEQQQDLPGISEGIVFVEEDKWIDTLIWIDKDPVPIYTLFSWETENPSNYYIERRLVTQFADFDKYQFELEVYEGQIAVDQITVISQNKMNYLESIYAAYNIYGESINELFDRDILTENNLIVSNNEIIAKPTSTVIPADSMSNEQYYNVIFDNMLQHEDLPEEYRMYQISNKMVDTLDELRFEKTFLQGPTSSGGGLWITNEITIHKNPIESKVALMDTIGLNIRYENLRAEYPEVGEHALSFYRSPFERYLTSRGNITIDFYCNSLFTGSHPYCNPESLAELAQTIYDRLPVNMEKPSSIKYNFNENIDQEYFDDIGLQYNEQGYQIQWIAKEYLPPMEIALYHEDLEEFTYVEKLVNPQNPQIGEGSTGLGYGQASDSSGILPGNYTVYVIVDGNLAAQFPFKMENVQ